jgi:hypothetical protein
MHEIFHDRVYTDSLRLQLPLVRKRMHTAIRPHSMYGLRKCLESIGNYIGHPATVQGPHKAGACRPGKQTGHGVVQQTVLPEQTHAEFVEDPHSESGPGKSRPCQRLTQRPELGDRGHKCASKEALGLDREGGQGVAQISVTLILGPPEDRVGLGSGYKVEQKQQFSEYSTDHVTHMQVLNRTMKLRASMGTMPRSKKVPKVMARLRLPLTVSTASRCRVPASPLSCATPAIRKEAPLGG